ncbi:MAG: hypothetical protein QM775_35430 [Pirellulales bacterium]
MAVLKDHKEPWPTQTARELGYAFNGYLLDADRRPTFMYTLGSATVGDGSAIVGETFEPIAGKRPGMLRTVHISGNIKGPVVRVAVGKQIKEVKSDERRLWYDVDGLYRVKADSTVIRSTADGMELLVIVCAMKSGTSASIEYAW